MNSTASKVNPRNVIGGAMGWFDETGYEREGESFSVSDVAKEVTGAVFEGIMSLGEDLSGSEKSESSESRSMPSKGTIEFNKKQEAEQKKQEQSADKRMFMKALQEDQARAEAAKNKLLFEEEINDIATNLSTDEKNALLHYQASYRDRSIYQRAEIRRKIIEQRKTQEKQSKEASVTETKGVSAMNAAMEGGSGSQGGGQANLSAQATG